MASRCNCTNNTIYFFGQKNDWRELSQFYESAFEVNGETYLSTEQWYHAAKASCFDDEATREAIMTATTPVRCKKLGRQVKHFDNETWSRVKYDIVLQGNRIKFSRSERADHLQALLLSTGSAELVEASPWDKEWGIGYSRFTAEASRGKWGKNLLGKILMQVRSELKAQEDERLASIDDDGDF